MLLAGTLLAMMACGCTTCTYPQEGYSYTVGNLTEDTFIVRSVNFKQPNDSVRVDTLLPGHQPVIFYFEYDGTKKGVTDIHPDRISVFKSLVALKMDSTASNVDLLSRDRWGFRVEGIEAKYTLAIDETLF